MTALTTHGVIAAGDWQTAEAGATMLRQGGNAVDAALASAFAAFVCELPLCSPLGGGALLVERPGGDVHALDLFARAPGLDAERPPELDFADVEVDFGAATQVFHVGRGSAAVPLALPGLLQAHRRWGSRPLEAIVEPAVALGRHGYVLGSGVAFVIRLLAPILGRTEACGALHFEAGVPPEAGSRLLNRALASTLEWLAKRPERLEELYSALAREFGPKAGGLIGPRDLEAACVEEREPVRVEHRGFRLSTMPGPSTGGVLVALGLRLLEGVGSHGFLSTEHLLRVCSVQELLLGERDEHFDERCRDPAAVRALLDERRVAELRARVGERVGPRADNPLGSTTHISAIDEHGTAVALTLTNGESSGHVLSDTGMVVNNLLGEEDIHPRGFHLDPPGSPLSTMMAPTLLRRGERSIALGSGGSNRLRNAILQVLVAVLEHGIDPTRAVSAPRLHLDATAAGHRIAFELPGLDAVVQQVLLERYPDAPRVFDERNLYFGGVHLASTDGSRFAAIGDPRRSGAFVIV